MKQLQQALFGLYPTGEGTHRQARLIADVVDGDLIERLLRDKLLSGGQQPLECLQTALLLVTEVPLRDRIRLRARVLPRARVVLRGRHASKSNIGSHSRLARRPSRDHQQMINGVRRSTRSFWQTPTFTDC